MIRPVPLIVFFTLSLQLVPLRSITAEERDVSCWCALSRDYRACGSCPRGGGGGLSGRPPAGGPAPGQVPERLRGGARLPAPRRWPYVGLAESRTIRCPVHSGRLSAPQLQECGMDWRRKAEAR